MLVWLLCGGKSERHNHGRSDRPRSEHETNRFAVKFPLLHAVNHESRRLHGRFLWFAPISSIVPQKSSNIHALDRDLLTVSQERDEGTAQAPPTGLFRVAHRLSPGR